MLTHDQVVLLQIARHNARSGHASDVDALGQLLLDLVDELIGAAIAYVAVSARVERVEPECYRLAEIPGVKSRSGKPVFEPVEQDEESSTGESEAAAIMLDARAADSKVGFGS